MPSSENGPESEKPTSDQDPSEQATHEDYWRVGRSILGRIAKIREKLHNIFGPGDDDDPILHLSLRIFAGMIGPYMTVPPFIIYYSLTNPEALHRYVTVELANTPYIWGAFCLTALIGGGIGAGQKKGTFFRHAWKSLVDVVILYVLVGVGLRFVEGVLAQD